MPCGALVLSRPPCDDAPVTIPRDAETTDPPRAAAHEQPVSDQIESWLNDDADSTLGSLAEHFGKKSFALLFIFLLGFSALPIPTGGATHVFDIVAVLVAAQLVVGRKQIWIPRRWQGIALGGERQQRVLNWLLRFIRFLERFSRPRMRGLLGNRASNAGFGLAVIALTAAAFFAPPFSGLDTLPALGVVLISLGVLLEDIVLVGLGAAVGVGGVVLEVTVGKAAISWVKGLF